MYVRYICVRGIFPFLKVVFVKYFFLPPLITALHSIQTSQLSLNIFLRILRSDSSIGFWWRVASS